MRTQFGETLFRLEKNHCICGGKGGSFVAFVHVLVWLRRENVGVQWGTGIPR